RGLQRRARAVASDRQVFDRAQPAARPRHLDAIEHDSLLRDAEFAGGNGRNSEFSPVRANRATPASDLPVVMQSSLRSCMTLPANGLSVIFCNVVQDLGWSDWRWCDNLRCSVLLWRSLFWGEPPARRNSSRRIRRRKPPYPRRRSNSRRSGWIISSSSTRFKRSLTKPRPRRSETGFGASDFRRRK